MNRGIIQVAGVLDLQEATMLVREGVDWIGFPLRLDVHKEDVSDDVAAAIVESLPADAAGVLITYLRTADEIDALCRRLGTYHVQIHGDIAIDELRKLRDVAPELFLMKSLVVQHANAESLFRAVDLLAPHVDAFITDTFDPRTGASGATGKVHDWRVSRLIVNQSPRPVMLAGGLTPSNVARAIEHVRPAAVDAHTGLEDSTGCKSPALVREFVAEARRAFAESGV